MKNQHLFSLVFLGLLFLFLASKCETKPPGPGLVLEEYNPYPPQCDISQFAIDTIPHSSYYPLPASTLEGWVARSGGPQDGHLERQHAYQVFADLQQVVDNKKGQQVWRWQTWPTATQALKESHHSYQGVKKFVKGPTNLLEHNRVNSKKTFKTQQVPIDFAPPGYVIPDFVCETLPKSTKPTKAGCVVPIKGCRFQNNGDLLIAGVIYNRDAYNWIRNKKLYDWETVANKWKDVYNKPAGGRNIEQFPHKSIVLKPMFWPVSADGYTALPVWRDSIAANGQNFNRYSGFEEKDIWQTAVAITTQTDNPLIGKTTDSVTYLYDVYTDATFKTPLGPHTYQNPKVVSIDDFYHRKISAEELASMDVVDLAIINQSAYWAYKRPFQAGDYLALVAMHVVTKEMPSWTLQSFWWSDEATTNDSKYATARNKAIQNLPTPPSKAFDNYLMVSVYGQEAFKDSAAAGTAVWPLSFNPYIELAAAHPIRTSCRNCHQRGAFPNKAQKDSLSLYGNLFPKIENYAFYLEPNPDYPKLNPDFPGPLAMFDTTNAVMNNLLMMDFQWTLTDRLVVPHPE